MKMIKLSGSINTSTFRLCTTKRPTNGGRGSFKKEVKLRPARAGKQNTEPGGERLWWLQHRAGSLGGSPAPEEPLPARTRVPSQPLSAPSPVHHVLGGVVLVAGGGQDQGSPRRAQAPVGCPHPRSAGRARPAPPLPGNGPRQPFRRRELRGASRAPAGSVASH